MMSSAATDAEECSNYSKRLNRLPSSLSSTSSRSFSSSTSSPPPSSISVSDPHHSPGSTKTMEEVWKDINLASLSDHNPCPIAFDSNLRSGIFQDFLARPFDIDPPTSMISSASETAASSLYGPTSPTPPPGTALSLSSGDPLRSCRESQLLQPHHHHPDSNVSSFSTPFETLASASGFPGLRRRTFPESDSNSGDRRHKRMIKNRESASRSRARKQAYIFELELKVNFLAEENERLRLQNEQLFKAVASNHKKKKNSLHRTLTAPF